MRKPYNQKHQVFLESDLVSKDPLEQFKSWFEEASSAPGIIEANAMCLSTASKSERFSPCLVLSMLMDIHVQDRQALSSHGVAKGLWTRRLQVFYQLL